MNSIDSSIVESTAQQKMFRKSSLSTDAENKKKRELKVLFVSKRDMCRGPMAECIFNYLADKYNLKSFSRFIWRAHSSGMDCYRYNLGNLPDQLSLRVLAENRLETQHGCRQASLRPWSFCFFSVARAKVYCNLLNFVRLMSHWDVEKFWEWLRKGGWRMLISAKDEKQFVRSSKWMILAWSSWAASNITKFVWWSLKMKLVNTRAMFTNLQRLRKHF